ncbi:hypothetical protein [Prauserella cavernicola]|nr:hypothetical protein [Prauserella cavernicola]
MRPPDSAARSAGHRRPEQGWTSGNRISSASMPSARTRHQD